MMKKVRALAIFAIASVLAGAAAPQSPHRVLDKPGAYCEAYAPCSGGAQVQLCVTETGGHSWPGGHKPRAAGAAPSDAISANDVMWKFFDRR
jgi:polyhydroxybutyrate depolymerase